MKRKLGGALLGCVIGLAGCGGEFVSGPGEVSLGGLTYDVRDGGKFVGEALTPVAAMPTGSVAVYSGVLRGNILGTYRSGDLDAQADFAAGSIDVQGSVDFTGSGSQGIVAFNETATISGNGFSHSDVSLSNPTNFETINGNFYGPSAELIGGTAVIGIGGGDVFTGAFVASQ